MAEPDSILQLGIEAARDGNKEEARNLFRLLTRQEPNSAPAWLWLAGVAENREERQAALERVVAIDPTNEMAVKGLQALGVRSGSAEPPQAVVAPPPLAPQPEAAPSNDDLDPFAELDALSDVMADAEPTARREPVAAAPINSFDADAPPPDRDDRRTSPTLAGSSAARADRNLYDDDELEPDQRGPSPLLWALLFLTALGLIGLAIVFLFLRPGDQPPGGIAGAEQTSIAATSAAGTDTTAQAGAEPTPILGGEGGEATAEPTEPQPEPTEPEPAPTEPEPEPQPPAPDPAEANPAIVPANTPLESQGWLYDFNQPTYAAPIIGPIGGFQPNNGRFVVVLAFAVNNTGQEQAIPGDFFVLKDAQGRVWEARPDVSSAYVIPGVNADLAHTQPLPPDGLTRSVALIFDVAPDATNLVFFARSNPGQGWQVLQSV
jgi:hypothetical protein